MKSKGSRKTRAVRPAGLELERQTLRDLNVRGQGPAGGKAEEELKDQIKTARSDACKFTAR